MPKRPKRELRKKWQNQEVTAEKADLAVRNSATSSQDDRLLILDHKRLWLILVRFGIPQLGRSRLKELGVEAIQLRRLFPAEDLPSWVPKRARVSAAPKRADTVSAELIEKLLRGIQDEQLRGQARLEIDGWVIDVREAALLRHARAWVNRQLGGQAPADPHVPRFKRDQGGALVFDPLDSEVVRRSRDAEFRALMKRVDEVIPSKSFLTVGEGIARSTLMEWRTLLPLLQWRESAFTERHWSELSDDELRRFIEAGYERENILSNRDDDLTRVRSALRGRRPRPRAPEESQPRRTPEEEAWDDFESIGAEEIRRLAEAELEQRQTGEKAD